MRPTRDRLWARIAVALVLWGFLAWHLRRLQDPPLPLEDMAAMAGLALLPAAAALILGRRAFAPAAVAAAIAAIGVATGHWPVRDGYFDWLGDIGGSVEEGVRGYASEVLPYDGRREPDIRAMLLLVVFALVLAFGYVWFVHVRPVLAVLIAAIPFGVCSTVFVLPAPAVRAAGFLALALGMLAIGHTGGSRRSAGRAAFAACGLAVLALLVTAAPGIARGPFLDWRDWALAREGKRVGVGYVWSHSYRPLEWPEKSTEVFRVRSPIRSYWRATTLETFDGQRWVDTGAVTQPGYYAAAGETLYTPRVDYTDIPLSLAGDDRLRVEQFKLKFEIEALDERFLLSAAQPVSYDVPASAQQALATTAGVAQTAWAPLRGTTYDVTARRVDPDPELLQDAGLAYPDSVVSQNLMAFPGQPVDPFGTPGRDIVVRQILTDADDFAQTAGWLEAYNTAKDLTRGIDDPFSATQAVEAYFRSRYTYDETAGLTGPSPLPGFITSPSAGYCQMFSGAMAQMLRLLGIPARIAEGFTPGTYDLKSGEYVVTDREAHAWVEVYFPGFGWLPFDPTPTRNVPSRSSVSTATGSAFFGERSSEAGAQGTRARTPDGNPAREFPSGVGGLGAGVAADEGDSGYHPGILTFAFLAALLVACAIWGLKRLRALVRYRRGDPRARASAARAEITDYARDQGVELARSLTHRELADRVSRDLGVDCKRWAAAADRARWSPPARAGEAADELRVETRKLRKELSGVIGKRDRAAGAVSLRSLIGPE